MKVHRRIHQHGSTLKNCSYLSESSTNSTNHEPTINLPDESEQLVLTSTTESLPQEHTCNNPTLPKSTRTWYVQNPGYISRMDDVIVDCQFSVTKNISCQLLVTPCLSQFTSCLLFCLSCLQWPWHIFQGLLTVFVKGQTLPA